MTTNRAGRATRAVIDAAAVRGNFARVRSLVPPGVALMAVVKADAYGHGAGLVAPLLARAGADWFGVATVEEGIELRRAGIAQPVLVLAGAGGADVDALVEQRLSVAVLDAEMARDLAAAAGGRRLPVHVKVDTGMGRMGVLPADLASLARVLAASGCLEVEGLFSHFGNSERVDYGFSDAQVEAFRGARAALAAAGIEPRWVHLANSAATLTRPEVHFAMARPGIVLYGVGPGEVAVPDGVRPVMRLESRLIQVKSVPAGFAVSYGQSFVTRRPSRIGVVPIGYADGYDRRLSNRAAVLVRGRRARVVGTVCMDVMMVDLTEIPAAQAGDEVVLWGTQDGAEITVDEVAGWQGTVAYEVLTRVGKRVSRLLADGRDA